MLRPTLIGVCMAAVLSTASPWVRAQTSNTPPNDPQRDAAQRDAQEQRREQDRQTQLREQQEKSPDVRINTTTPPAQTLPNTETPCFAIVQIELRGQDAGPFGWLLDSLSGPQRNDSPLRKCLGAQGIGVLLQRAQSALVDKGFVTTRVLAEPQDLSQGNLVLTVLPGRIANIRFQPPAAGAGPSDPEVKPTSIASAAPFRSGDVLNLRDIEQTLENLKRVPTAEADIQILPGDAPDASDLAIAYTTQFPLRFSFSLDDAGGKSTGRYQGSATVSWDNPLRLNDLFYLTQSHDAGGGDPGPRGTRGHTLHYDIPAGYWLFGTTLGRSHYYQSVQGNTQSYTYSGTSENTEIKASALVYRDAVRKTSLSLKAWQRKSNNYIDDTEVQVQRRVVGGWEFGLNHKDAAGSATLDSSLSYKRGTTDFEAIAAPEEAFNEGTAQLGVYVLDFNLAVPFKALDAQWRYSAALRMQDNATPLTPQDRFAIGGRYTVRGFDGESALVGERGWSLRNDWALVLPGGAQEAYIALDAGEVGGPSSNASSGLNLAGSVIGLRGSYKRAKASLQYDFFLGGPLHKPIGFKTADTTAGFSTSLSF